MPPVCLIVVSGSAVGPSAGGVGAIANVVLNNIGGLQPEYDHSRFHWVPAGCNNSRH